MKLEHLVWDVMDLYCNKPLLFQSSLPQARSVSEIAAELSRSTSSLQGSLGSDSISRSGSSASLPSLTTSRFDCKYQYPLMSYKYMCGCRFHSLLWFKVTRVYKHFWWYGILAHCHAWISPHFCHYKSTQVSVNNNLYYLNVN